MPSVSKKQHNLMALVANDPKAAKRLGIPRSVGKEFMKADKGKSFKEGGEMKESKKMVKKEVEFMKKKGAPKSMIKHEMAEMKGYKHGGKVKKMADGGLSAQLPLQRRIFDGNFPQPSMPSPIGGNRGGAYGGLDSVNQGSRQIGQSLGTIQGALGVGGGSQSNPAFGEPQLMYKKGGKVKKMADGGMPMNPRMAAAMKKRAATKAAPMQGRAPMARPVAQPLAPTPTVPMKKGGSTMSRMASKGEHPIQKKSKRGAEIVKMAKGGMVKASAMGKVVAGGKRPHGEHTVQQKGHTRGTMVKMAAGGMGKKYC